MNPLELLEDPLRAILDFLHDPINLTYGWCIVVLTVMVRTALLPLVYEELRSLGARIVEPLEKKPWGLRQFTVEDIDGNRFYFFCN